MFRAALFRLPLLRAVQRISPKPLLPTAARYFHRSAPRLLTAPPKDEPTSSLTLSQRLKHLIKSYGWYAIGVYFLLSALDFGVAFAGINLIGAEQVSRVVGTVKESVSAMVHSRPPEPGREQMDDAPREGAAVKGGQEGLYAMLVLAYTVHKTLFLPVRVGLTAAFTPRLVGWLTRRGWVGKSGAKRAATEMRDKYRNARGQD